jgi:hypothetical protein
MYAVYHERQKMSPKVRMFVDFLAASLRTPERGAQGSATWRRVAAVRLPQHAKWRIAILVVQMLDTRREKQNCQRKNREIPLGGHFKLTT